MEYQSKTELPPVSWKCLKCDKSHAGNEGCPDCRNSGFITMTAEQRFNSLDRMATTFFATARWKAEFCRLYDLTPQTLTSWTNKGAPVWAAQAMADALKAKRLTDAVALIQEATMGDEFS